MGSSLRRLQVGSERLARRLEHDETVRLAVSVDVARQWCVAVDRRGSCADWSARLELDGLLVTATAQVVSGPAATPGAAVNRASELGALGRSVRDAVVRMVTGRVPPRPVQVPVPDAVVERAQRRMARAGRRVSRRQWAAAVQHRHRRPICRRPRARSRHTRRTSGTRAGPGSGPGEPPGPGSPRTLRRGGCA